MKKTGHFQTLRYCVIIDVIQIVEGRGPSVVKNGSDDDYEDDEQTLQYEKKGNKYSIPSRHNNMIEHEFILLDLETKKNYKCYTQELPSSSPFIVYEDVCIPKSTEECVQSNSLSIPINESNIQYTPYSLLAARGSTRRNIIGRMKPVVDTHVLQQLSNKYPQYVTDVYSMTNKIFANSYTTLRNYIYLHPQCLNMSPEDLYNKMLEFGKPFMQNINRNPNSPYAHEPFSAYQSLLILVDYYYKSMFSNTHDRLTSNSSDRNLTTQNDVLLRDVITTNNNPSSASITTDSSSSLPSPPLVPHHPPTNIPCAPNMSQDTTETILANNNTGSTIKNITSSLLDIIKKHEVAINNRPLHRFMAIVDRLWFSRYYFIMCRYLLPSQVEIFLGYSGLHPSIFAQKCMKWVSPKGNPLSLYLEDMIDLQAMRELIYSRNADQPNILSHIESITNQKKWKEVRKFYNVIRARCINSINPTILLKTDYFITQLFLQCNIIRPVDTNISVDNDQNNLEPQQYIFIECDEQINNLCAIVNVWKNSLNPSEMSLPEMSLPITPAAIRSPSHLNSVNSTATIDINDTSHSPSSPSALINDSTKLHVPQILLRYSTNRIVERRAIVPLSHQQILDDVITNTNILLIDNSFRMYDKLIDSLIQANCLCHISPQHATNSDCFIKLADILYNFYSKEGVPAHSETILPLIILSDVHQFPMDRLLHILYFCTNEYSPALLNADAVWLEREYTKRQLIHPDIINPGAVIRFLDHKRQNLARMYTGTCMPFKLIITGISGAPEENNEPNLFDYLLEFILMDSK